MDPQGNSQSESGKLEQIVSQFLLKILHVILDSRIPSIHQHNCSGDLSSAYRVRKSDKWFNLVLGDRPAALDNLNFWHRNLMDPMIIDIILVHQGSSSSSAGNLYSTSGVGASAEAVIERWIVQYESPQVMSRQPPETSASHKKTYRKFIMLLRSIYSLLRLLPAYQVFRQLHSSSQKYNFDVIYKVSSFSSPFSMTDGETTREFFFVPVEALPGHLYVSLTYRPTLSNFNLGSSTALPPQIITDYVCSPSTNPIRSSPSSEKGVHATSFPLRGIRPPSGPFQRPHSWTSGFHKAAPFTQNQPLGGSPPAYRSSPLSDAFSSSPTDNYSHRAHNRIAPAHQRPTSSDEYQLSPPFSASASPSPPTQFSNCSMQTRIRSETLPVAIPFPMTGRSFKYLSPNFSDPNKHSLPPLSPRSTKHDPSSQESPSGSRAYRRTESLGFRESQVGAVNHYSGPKVVLFFMILAHTRVRFFSQMSHALCSQMIRSISYLVL